MLSFRVLSALLSYPEPELLAALGEAGEILAGEAVVPESELRPLLDFAAELVAMDPYAAQERYVALFDRTRSLSLHLYEHVHGESRDRGQAMVDLAETYRLHGLEMRRGELPDYLPLFLEFLSELPPAVARSYLAEAAAILAALRQRLAECESSYETVLAALSAIAAVKVERAAIDEVLATLPPEDDDPAALDRRWQEEAVSFLGADGPGDLATPACGRA